MKRKSTKVISFRVHEDLAKQIDKAAKRAKTIRGDFVKSLLIPAFEQHIQTSELKKQAA